MQTNSSISPKSAAPATIPAEVLERLENEWRQVRRPAPQGTASK